MFRRKIRVTLITLIPKHTACSISWNWIQQTFTCQYLSSPYLQLWNYKDLISNLMAMSFPKKKIGLSTAAFLPSDTPSCLTWISSTHKSALSWSDARFKKKNILSSLVWHQMQVTSTMRWSHSTTKMTKLSNIIMLICKGKGNDFLKRRVASHTHIYCMPMFMIIYSYDVLVFWNNKQCWLNLSVVYVVVSKIFYGLKMVKQLIL